MLAERPDAAGDLGEPLLETIIDKTLQEIEARAANAVPIQLFYFRVATRLEKTAEPISPSSLSPHCPMAAKSVRTI